MPSVIANRTDRNIKVGLNGKAYWVDATGALVPQPTGRDATQILMLRKYHRREDLAPARAPETMPSLSATEVPPGPPTPADVDPVLAATSILDKVEAVVRDPIGPPKAFDTLPEKPAEDQLETEGKPKGFDFASLSKADLIEILTDKGLVGLTGKTKAELVALIEAV